MLEKDQKRIRCQHQLMSVLQERGKNKVRWVFLAMHHSVFPICPQELRGTARHLCQGTWTCGVSGILLSTTVPKRTDQPLFWQHQDFPPGAPPHWAGSPGEGKETWVLVWPGTAIGFRVRAALLTGRQWMSMQGLAVSGSGRWNPLDLWAVAGYGTTLLPCPRYTTSHFICLHLQDCTDCAGLEKCR